MVQYKLTYFNARGRAETARMIFVAADQKFDDVRIDAEEWQSRKKDFKNGKLPVLDIGIGIGIGSEQLTQSVAIIKYLGGLFGYAGKSRIDAARCHAMVETMRDIFYPVTTRVFSEKDQQKRGEIIKEIAPELKRFLTMFEDLTKANESGFLVGSHVSFADFELFTIVTTIENLLGADSIKEFPHIVKNRQLIVALPKLKEYLAKLAKTEF